MTTLPGRTKRPTLLAQIFDDPQLVSAVQALEPRALAALVRHVGLEEAGDLVALATRAQLEQVFDEDLWRNAGPGEEERFDPARFSLWLEVLLESGAERVAETLSGMDEDFVTLALSHEMFVLDVDALDQQRLEASVHAPAEGLRIEQALERSPCFELDAYLLVSSGSDAWDALLAVLVELDVAHHDLLIRLLERCRQLSAERIDDSGGLYEVLTAAEQLHGDVAGEREARREREGFVPPQGARSFLALAREARVGQDPITRSHFWHVERAAAVATTAVDTAAIDEEPSRHPARMRTPLLELLAAAGAVPSSTTTPQLTAGGTSGPKTHPRIRALLDEDPEHSPARLHELGYLANVLLSGCAFQGGTFRPTEALQAAAATCELGLEEMARRPARGPTGADATHRHRLVEAFGVGFGVLHREVEIPSAQRLRALGGAGAPETLAIVTALAVPCPTFAGSFVSTRAQIATIQDFLQTLATVPDPP